MSDTIAAIATAPARAALGILRLSGNEAHTIAARLFRPARGGSLLDRRMHTLVLGDLLDERGEALDQALAVCARAPRSFTGEDTVEFHCHGSPTVLAAALRALFALGARQALPGEFTRRAFLNGRLDLTQAEAVADIIDSESAQAAKNAAAQLTGAVSSAIEGVYQTLLGLEAHFQAAVDYPDEGLPPPERAAIAAALAEAGGTLARLLGSFRRGQLLREGVACAILGRPNVGKSSLLNALLGYERAIVTPLAGTTRDTLSEKLTLGGVLLRLTDTAGLRESADEAEALGVRRAFEAGREAALVLAVFDGSAPLGPEDEAVVEAALRAPAALALVNKSDLPQTAAREALESRFQTVLPVSARTGDGLEALEAAVGSLLAETEPAPVGEILTNARQYSAILRAKTALDRAREALDAGLTPDAVLTDAEEALQALGEVSGRSLRQDLVDAIFSRFCVGK